MTEKKYVMAIDQGTTSSRAIIFDHCGSIVSVGQKEHEQILPKAGWVEHDPIEIRDNIREVIGQALSKANINRHEIAAVGVTNQRETAVVWDKNTGEPVYNAIVWQDTRTDKIVRELAGDEGPDKYKEICGLGLATYFSGPKIKWILDNVEGAREKAEAGDLLFGNTDTWVIWNLTGGPNGGVHVTDVTNASRTMLMDVRELTWREDICADMTIPMSMLPEIKSSSEIYGYGSKNSLIIDTPISGDLGDQQAATFGQACFEKGMAKNTYGTGCFMLINTGNEAITSKNGLLTTLCYKIGDQDPVYALEGSIAVTGSLVQWLRDQLGIITTAPEIETLADSVEDNGGVYIVPAFSGLFAPYWKDDARGAIVGLTRYNNKGHLARAVLEATAFQTAEVLEAMNADSGVDLEELRVDGGMTANDALMQFQADILGVDVVKPVVAETTALGAAYAAGIAVGFWDGEQDVIDNWQEDKRWSPKMEADERARQMRLWKKAVTRTFDWVDDDVRGE
ncbi:glycerol kinase GlpK [Trueperella pyogenes]|uniref:glycerol kinase GlpK n=2 Tax=Trueperella pyogenes TaxID=1661 RepID=UPI000C1B70E9|nr:glycerol kinase GlpK [Trueperella pyogenes]AZQ99904.1 glycerol kinase [Trueperella pyogenes]PIN51172.1 glycerol kinase [Trueperella pyogenes]UVJ56144.1 glycerol kinase GlpK [Trueperella pyogenes]UVJ58164.1 glycerol kinase GlpK [Trueperella pyogenes]UVJ60160.1 glycerol kinase GlpK [Trueperella pyogenes]